MPTPSASGGTPAPQYERWTVGIARRPLDRAPPARRRCARAGTPAHADAGGVPDGRPGRRGARGRRRTLVRVWLAVPPNESRGWVRDGQMAFYTTASKIVIDLSQRELMVYRRGELLRTFPVAVGRPGLETPSGHFFITQKLRPPDPERRVWRARSSAPAPRSPSSTGGRTAGSSPSTAPTSRGSSARPSATAACA